MNLRALIGTIFLFADGRSNQSVCTLIPPTPLSVCLSVRLSVSVCLSVCLRLSVSLCLSVCLFSCLVSLVLLVIFSFLSLYLCPVGHCVSVLFVIVCLSYHIPHVIVMQAATLCISCVLQVAMCPVGHSFMSGHTMSCPKHHLLFYRSLILVPRNSPSAK